MQRAEHLLSSGPRDDVPEMVHGRAEHPAWPLRSARSHEKARETSHTPDYLIIRHQQENNKTARLVLSKREDPAAAPGMEVAFCYSETLGPYSTCREANDAGELPRCHPVPWGT